LVVWQSQGFELQAQLGEDICGIVEVASIGVGQAFINGALIGSDVLAFPGCFIGSVPIPRLWRMTASTRAKYLSSTRADSSTSNASSLAALGCSEVRWRTSLHQSIEPPQDDLAANLFVQLVSGAQSPIQLLKSLKHVVPSGLAPFNQAVYADIVSDIMARPQPHTRVA
jgi:hypothetical protein